VTTNSDLDQIVEQYLSRLKVALADLPAERRQQLIDSITDHISEARVALSANSEVAIRDILDRVGQPADIAAEALTVQAPPPLSRASSTRRATIAVIAIVVVALLVFGGLLVSRSNNGIRSTTTSTVTSVSMVVVPDVVRLTLGAAQAELQAVDLLIGQVFISACAGSPGPPGVVTSQAPVGGSSSAKGSQIRLTVTSSKSCP